MIVALLLREVLPKILCYVLLAIFIGCITIVNSHIPVLRARIECVHNHICSDPPIFFITIQEISK